MRVEFYYPSKGAGQIHACKWLPDGEIIAIVQIIHGIAEHIERYDSFAQYLNALGIAVVAEDHMGHGKSVENNESLGYFCGGWFRAVADSYELLTATRKEFPDVPYILFGHSMGSFMARTILCKYPDSGISGAIICGTGWQPRAMLPAVIKLCDAICKKIGEQNPSPVLDKLIFGSYNKKVEHVRTPSDWLTRDSKCVDQYINDPLCGFTASCGLLRDMLKGISYIEDPDNLQKMKKSLPVFFIAGESDPVGSYGKGVLQASKAFMDAGMSNVTTKLFPLCRHEILNEINKDEVNKDIANWIHKTIYNV